jgi:hypothetical protein
MSDDLSVLKNQKGDGRNSPGPFVKRCPGRTHLCSESPQTTSSIVHHPSPCAKPPSICIVPRLMSVLSTPNTTQRHSFISKLMIPVGPLRLNDLQLVHSYHRKSQSCVIHRHTYGPSEQETQSKQQGTSLQWEVSRRGLARTLKHTHAAYQHTVRKVTRSRRGWA